MRYDNDRLNAALKLYLGTEPLPMHMPGHKRNPDLISDVFRRDITEISGFDNLHAPTGLLKDLEDACATLWGYKSAYCSVGGATAMILSAVMACTASNPSSNVLVAMNCHLSVWHALELSGSKIVPISPMYDASLPFPGPISPRDIENILIRDPSIKTVIITSPTYEGVLSDTNEIHRITRKYDACLIVDCAHGAHLGLDDDFFGPDQTGDIVIKSLHKTLNAPTQTALMLVNETCRIKEDVIRGFIDVFETTSPSYILLGGISRCVASLNKNHSILKPWEEGILYCEEALAGLKNFRLYQAPVRERSKLVLLGNGAKLADHLRSDWNVECEACYSTHLIAMTGIGDTPDSLKRFCDAVAAVDEAMGDGGAGFDSARMFIPRPDPLFGMNIREASLKGIVAEERRLSENCGMIAGEYLFAYPPGVPILIPGEVITDKTVGFVKSAGSSLLLSGGRKFDGMLKVLS